MTIAGRAFESIRRMLSSPPRDVALWRNLTLAERKAVLTMACLPAAWRRRDWVTFTLQERQKILDQVQRASGWAERLRAVE